EVIEFPTDVSRFFAVEIVSGLWTVPVAADFISFEQFKRHKGIKEIARPAFGNPDVGSEHLQIPRPMGQRREDSEFDGTEQCLAGPECLAKAHDAIGCDGRDVHDELPWRR